MLNTALLNLARGNRMSTHLGLQMDEGRSLKYANDYLYVQLPLRGHALAGSDEVVTAGKVMRNQHVRIESAATINVRGNHRYVVKTHPKLQEVATCPTLFIIDNQGEGEQVHFHATFRKDFDLQELPWITRVYMIA